MTVIVEINMHIGAVPEGAYFKLSHSTQGVLGADVLGPETVSLVDYSTRVMDLNVQRTSSRRVGPIVEYNAATATITLLNDDGALDPATLEQAAPGVLIKIHKVHAGVSYPIFWGYVDSWLPEHRAPDHATITVTATDAFSLLSGYTRPTAAAVGAGETSGARATRVLASALWAGETEVSGGVSTLQSTTLAGDALDEMHDLALNELGEFYFRPSGHFVFRGRQDLLTDPRSVTSQATFGSDFANGELPYVGPPGLSYDRQQLINKVRAKRTASGTTYTNVDSDSVARYGEYVHEQTDLTLNDDAQVQSWISAVLAMDKTPELRFTSIVIDTRVMTDLVMPHALGRDVGDRITVVRRPPGVTDARECFIRSITHTWSSPDRWITTWGLQPASKFESYFILGDATRGVLGTSVLSY